MRASPGRFGLPSQRFAPRGGLALALIGAVSCSGAEPCSIDSDCDALTDICAEGRCVAQAGEGGAEDDAGARAPDAGQGASPLDAGPPDAGPTDAGPPDAGPPPCPNVPLDGALTVRAATGDCGTIQLGAAVNAAVDSPGQVTLSGQLVGPLQCDPVSGTYNGNLQVGGVSAYTCSISPGPIAPDAGAALNSALCISGTASCTIDLAVP